MSDTLTPLSTFEDLRRAAIGYAQDASGEIWTDYNIHDPGVTLLEQTCFALSQLAYQTALPDRDLLTNDKHQFLFREMGLPRPRKVLRTAPVTRTDLEAWLSTCDAVEGVALAQTAEPGRYDMVVYDMQSPKTPQAKQKRAAELEAQMHAAFDRVRPLGTMLGTVTIATRVDVVLTGKIEIAPGILPDTIAAEIFHAVRSILSGHTHEIETAKGATRADVYDAPELLFDLPRQPGVRGLTLENHLGVIRKIPGIREIESLGMRVLETNGAVLEGPIHLYAVLPTRRDQIELTLSVNGAPMVIDHARLREDFIRIRAERLGQTHHHVDAPDWNVLRPGRRRRFDLSHVDALLPMLYQATGHRPDVNDSPRLAQYRAIIDGVLKSMSGALRNLPQTFHADLLVDLNRPEIYRARLALLNYFIALQGHEMPVTRHTGLHAYRGTAARHRFELEWRAQMLALAPELHATRGTGPGAAGPGGFLATLAVLCDLTLWDGATGTSALRDYGLQLANNAPLAEPKVSLLQIPKEVDDLLDLLPAEDPSALPFTPVDFIRYTAFVAGGKLCPKRFQRLADPMAIRVVPTGETFVIIVDFSDGSDTWTLDTIPDRAQVYHTAARIRATWRAMHRASETVRLVEAKPGHPGPPQAYEPVLLIPGWTHRCRQQSYRDYVTTQVAQLAPAHLQIHVLWVPCPDTEGGAE